MQISNLCKWIAIILLKISFPNDGTRVFQAGKNKQEKTVRVKYGDVLKNKEKNRKSKIKGCG